MTQFVLKKARSTEKVPTSAQKTTSWKDEVHGDDSITTSLPAVPCLFLSTPCSCACVERRRRVRFCNTSPTFFALSLPGKSYLRLTQAQLQRQAITSSLLRLSL